MNIRAKHGFTLTELLVVVLMVGILAAVVLPKYNKVIETVRVLEAEGIMRAVRNEQVSRCSLDKRYTVYARRLAALPSAASSGSTYTSNNFTYDLISGVGMTATSSKWGYLLEMPSYEDGRICCDNCSSIEGSYLNKNYPTCEELLEMEDYQAASDDCSPLPQI